MPVPDPLACTLFMIVAFTAAGLVQTLWLRRCAARPPAFPIDCGLTVRGRRVFGDNKTWKGFVVMVPAVGTAFAILALCGRVFSVMILAPWPLEPGHYFLLGCWSGFGFMLGELPNSFLKRQLDVSPGNLPTQPLGRMIGFVLDQTDSVLGALLALVMFVPLPWQTWITILLAGPVLHWLFNVLLMLLGVKARAA